MESQYWWGSSGTAVAPGRFCPASGFPNRTTPDPGPIQEDILAYELPPLPYDYAALEPHIDTETMKLHHDKHHAAYVNNLNGAIEKHPELGKHSPEDLLRNLNTIPEDVRAVVRNNGGGHVNHSMFWTIMKPKGGGEPTGKIAEQIKKDFGSLMISRSSSMRPRPSSLGRGGVG
jgi:Fe-Mn family superoxide dismutase